MSRFLELKQWELIIHLTPKGLIIKFDIIITVAMSRTHTTCGFWSAIFGLICRCRRSLYSEEELQQPCMYK